MTSKIVLTTAVMALGLTGCATVEGAGLLNSLSPAVQRGESYAMAHCSGCHELGSNQLRSSVGAPAFATLMQRYNPDSLDREMEAISEVGHYRMPPTSISRLERRDLIAYIDSL